MKNFKENANVSKKQTPAPSVGHSTVLLALLRTLHGDSHDPCFKCESCRQQDEMQDLILMSDQICLHSKRTL